LFATAEAGQRQGHLNAYESYWKNHIRPAFGHLAARRDRRADGPPVHDGEARHGLEAQHRE
jgi:hypothetical protein